MAKDDIARGMAGKALKELKNISEKESKSYTILVLSQSEYDAIADKDDNTLYIVK